MSNEYPRETIEYVYFETMLINGEPPNSALDFSLTTSLGRPVIWNPMEMVEGKHAFLLDGTLPPGEYRVWVRVSGAPESPVVQAGKIRIT